MKIPISIINSDAIITIPENKKKMNTFNINSKQGGGEKGIIFDYPYSLLSHLFKKVVLW